MVLHDLVQVCAGEAAAAGAAVATAVPADRGAVAVCEGGSCEEREGAAAAAVAEHRAAAAGVCLLLPLLCCSAGLLASSVLVRSARVALGL